MDWSLPSPAGLDHQPGSIPKEKKLVRQRSPNCQAKIVTLTGFQVYCHCQITACSLASFIPPLVVELSVSVSPIIPHHFGLKFYSSTYCITMACSHCPMLSVSGHFKYECIQQALWKEWPANPP